MLAKRIIPCLDVKNGRNVRGIRFSADRDAGDPVDLARRYDLEGADELVFYDITASADGRAIVMDLVRQVSEQVFIKNIDAISENKFENKKVIVKGCGGVKLTAGLYIAVTNKLQNVVHSLMFGEACSSVPVFKRSRAK